MGCEPVRPIVTQVPFVLNLKPELKIDFPENLPVSERREDIMAMIRQKGVEDLNGQIVQWAEELMQVSESGVWLLDARMPEEIDVDLEEQIEVYLAALRHFLTEKREELPVQLASLSAEDTAAIRQSFLRSSWRVLIWERVS